MAARWHAAFPAGGTPVQGIQAPQPPLVRVKLRPAGVRVRLSRCPAKRQLLPPLKRQRQCLHRWSFAACHPQARTRWPRHASAAACRWREG
jgi:hypothetical protein